MDAQETRQEEIDRLAKRLAELAVEDQRRAGVFDGVPSFIVLAGCASAWSAGESGSPRAWDAGSCRKCPNNGVLSWV